jgi:competence CoiA-like predicted nuclease
MNKYITLFTQAAQGCDYSIGCGSLWQIFYAESEEEVLADTREYIKENFTHLEGLLSTCAIHQIKEMIVPDLDEWYKEFKAEEQEEIKAGAEYKQYLKLKKKFEDG